MLQSFLPIKKNWGCPHQVGEGLLVLLEQSHYFNKNPVRANSTKKLRFLNGCLFLCCLRRGVIADAPPLHFFYKTHGVLLGGSGQAQ